MLPRGSKGHSIRSYYAERHQFLIINENNMQFGAVESLENVSDQSMIDFIVVGLQRNISIVLSLADVRVYQSTIDFIVEAL